jgi:microcystin degradation protein MlrC
VALFLHGQQPTLSDPMENFELRLEAAKEQLSLAQTAYVHSFARGDFAECSKAKRKVTKRMKIVSALVAEKLALR